MVVRIRVSDLCFESHQEYVKRLMLLYIFFLLWSMDIYTYSVSSVDWLELDKIMCLDWDSNPGPPDCQLGKHYYSFNEIIVQLCTTATFSFEIFSQISLQYFCNF